MRGSLPRPSDTSRTPAADGLSRRGSHRRHADRRGLWIVRVGTTSPSSIIRSTAAPLASTWSGSATVNRDGRDSPASLSGATGAPCAGGGTGTSRSGVALDRTRRVGRRRLRPGATRHGAGRLRSRAGVPGSPARSPASHPSLTRRPCALDVSSLPGRDHLTHQCAQPLGCHLLDRSAEWAMRSGYATGETSQRTTSRACVSCSAGRNSVGVPYRVTAEAKGVPATAGAGGVIHRDLDRRPWRGERSGRPATPRRSGAGERVDLYGAGSSGAP
jgi:hypothetical protein